MDSKPTTRACRAFLAVVLLALSGCTGVTLQAVRSAEGYKPVIHLDPKPQLLELSKEEYAEYGKLNPEVRSKIEANVKELQKDSLKAREAVSRYNNWAGTQNELTAKALGLSGGNGDAKPDAPGGRGN